MFCAQLFKGSMLTALLLLCAASPAAAQNGWVDARGEIACKWMDMHPNLYGAMSTMRTMDDEGVPREEIPSVLAAVISTYCPQHSDLYSQAKDYLTHMGNPAVVGL